MLTLIFRMVYTSLSLYKILFNLTELSHLFQPHKNELDINNQYDKQMNRYVTHQYLNDKGVA